MEGNPLAQQFTRSTLLRFALPNIIMMVFLSLYTIVDGMFISRLVGEVALSATNMFYPITSLQLAIGIMLGTGGSAIIALKMGKGDAQEAREDFTSITVITAIIGIMFTAVCVPLLKPILKLLGTSPIQMADCMTYADILLWFSPFLFLQVLFQIFFVTAGKPGLGLFLNILAGVTNMALDFVLMKPMKMGVAGAAIATGIGYCVPAVIGALYFFLNRSGTLYLVRLKIRPRLILKACSNGSSEMVSNVATAVTTFLFNIIFMKFWAENGVAAITILSYFQFVFIAIFMGFSMGISPIISYKYGAEDTAQLKKIFKLAVAFILLCSVGVYLLSNGTIRLSLSVFTNVGSSVYSLALYGFTIYALQFLFIGLSIFASALFTALGNGFVSAVISVSRTFIFLVGSLLILPNVWGELGVWLAVPVAEILGILVSVVFLALGRKKYGY